MSGRYGPHLCRRNGIFHFKMRVPASIKSQLGLSEISRSLRTYSKSEARISAAHAAARLKRIWSMLQNTEFSREIGLQIINEMFVDIQSKVDRQAFDERLPNIDPDYQAFRADERIALLEDQNCSENFNFIADRMINNRLLKRGKPPTWVSDDDRGFLREGVRRAQIEEQKLVKYRLYEKVLPYEPEDDMLSRADNFIKANSYDLSRNPKIEYGVTLGTAIKEHLREGNDRWTEKTTKDFSRKLGFLTQLLGEDCPLEIIDSKTMRFFRDQLIGLHKNHVNMTGQSIAQKQTSNEKFRISRKTAANIFSRCRAFFNWAANCQGYITESPAANVSFPFNHKDKTRPRYPWQKQQLEQLFSSPLYVGCKSKCRRHEAGKLVLRDGYYWLPLWAYYSGARAGELIQLHHSDIDLDHDIPHIKITEEGSGSIGSNSYKHVKSTAAERTIPIHPDLIDLGFLEFLKTRRRKNAVRVFPEIKFGKDGQASTVFSKWFGRYRRHLGISDTRTVFHSFRHSAEDAFRNATQPQYVIDAIIGHSDGKTSSVYGEGINLQRRYDAVCAMVLPVRVPEFWNSLNVGGE